MIIFLYGADTFRSRRLLQQLKEKYIREVDSNSASLLVFEGQNTSLKEIGDKIGAGSLFVKKRFVVIENLFKNNQEKIFKELPTYLKKLTAAGDNILVFRDEDLNSKNRPLKAREKELFLFLSKQPYSQEFKTLNNQQLISFAQKEFTTYQKKITPTALNLLLENNGDDLWLLTNEIKKLAYSSPLETINIDLVHQLNPISYEKNIFGLMDAICTKNKTLAVKLLNEQYNAGLSDEYLLSMLIRQFRVLLQIRQSLDQNTAPSQISKKLNIHPFVAKKGINQATNFSVNHLRHHINYLLHLDFINKNSQSDIQTELFWLISRL